MALIELNLEKPALKRTEITEGTEESSMRSVEIDEPTDTSAGNVDKIDTGSSEKPETDMQAEISTEDAEKETSGSSKSGRGRRMVRRAAMVGAMTGAAVAARKIRARRKQSQTQTEVDEDWQTADS